MIRVGGAERKKLRRPSIYNATAKKEAHEKRTKMSATEGL